MSNIAFCIVISSAPYSTSQFKEALDIVLAAGAFDRPTKLILEDDACYALVGDQDTKQIDQKNLLQIMKALPIYGIEEVFVCEESCVKRNLTTDDLAIPIQRISEADKTELIRNSETTIRF